MFGLFKSLTKNHAFENLDAQEFLAKLRTNPDAVLLDVRTPGEVAAGKIKGAVNLDFFDPAFASKVGRMDKQKPYFIYCRSGQRSANACRTMHEMGFSKLYNMAGGIIAMG
ncbi:MAG: rhodanese-like domain-containing protein [Saprospiraceae bacterium]